MCQQNEHVKFKVVRLMYVSVGRLPGCLDTEFHACSGALVGTATHAHASSNARMPQGP